jgi:signal transduction histidine kinase
VVHAARVSAVATLLIGVVYFLFVVAFNTIDAHRLVAQVDVSLHERLSDTNHQVTVVPPDRRLVDDDNDVDSAPIVLWRVPLKGHSETLSDGAPRLLSTSWIHTGQPATVAIGGHLFRLDAVTVKGGWLVAGQSLAEQEHIGRVLLAGELVAGVVLLFASYLGTLIIGLKASGPIEQARRRQLEFTADASHELRTPLSVIEAEVGLALRSDGGVTLYRDTLKRVRHESDRLRHLVEDMLWLARFDAEPPPPSDEPVDLASIADGCADRFLAIGKSQDMTIVVVRQGEGQAWISAPPEWIDRLTGVLVDNACRYAGQGGIVRLVVHVQGTWVNLAVEDSGPGIPVAERTRLFDRFHRAIDDGTGAGLGLAIADSIVRSTGGRWRVSEAEIGGARLEVTWHRTGSRDAPFRQTRTSRDSSIRSLYRKNHVKG